VHILQRRWREGVWCGRAVGCHGEVGEGKVGLCCFILIDEENY
jgi:hypothetical protein